MRVPQVVIVPGLAVRTYAEPAAEALRSNGFEAHLLRPPPWVGAPTDLQQYGRTLARDIDVRGREVDLLIGLSIGTQAATWTAVVTGRVKHLLLVSPTVDPRNRSYGKLLRSWLFGDPHDDPQNLSVQLRDWSHAGPLRIARGYRSCLRDGIEATLPRVSAPVTIVHADHDSLGSAKWAQELATLSGARYIRKIGAPHSWPVGDLGAFTDLVNELTA